MVNKRVRVWTTGRSYLVSNFVECPPSPGGGDLARKNTMEPNQWVSMSVDCVRCLTRVYVIWANSSVLRLKTNWRLSHSCFHTQHIYFQWNANKRWSFAFLQSNLIERSIAFSIDCWDSSACECFIAYSKTNQLNPIGRDWIWLIRFTVRFTVDSTSCNIARKCKSTYRKMEK